MPAYITRTQAGLSPPRYTTPQVPKVTRLILHHGAGQDGDRDGDYQDEAAILREYQRHHLDQGWADVAYSHALDFDGRLYTLRGWGTSPGATEGYNRSRGGSYALVVIGNGDQPITDKMVAAAIAWGRDGILRGVVVPRPEVEDHSHYASTHCAGNGVRARLDEIRAGILDGASPPAPAPPQGGPTVASFTPPADVDIDEVLFVYEKAAVGRSGDHYVDMASGRLIKFGSFTWDRTLFAGLTAPHTPGLFLHRAPNLWYIKHSLTGGEADITTSHGSARHGDRPMLWFDSEAGVHRPAVWRPGTNGVHILKSY